MAFEGKYDPNKKTYIDPDKKTYKLFRQNDNISHFICRLAYCRNEELRKWFLAQETRLFAIRLKATPAHDVLDLLREHLGISYETLKETDPEWMDKDKREAICFKLKGEIIKAESFIKVPFKEALSLVARR